MDTNHITAGDASIATGRDNMCGTHDYMVGADAMQPGGVLAYMVCRRCGRMLALTDRGPVDLGDPRDEYNVDAIMKGKKQ